MQYLVRTLSRDQLLGSLVVGVEGHGLDKQNHGTVKHVCKSCGDDSAFCCATKRGGGATKGMEKK